MFLCFLKPRLLLKPDETGAKKKKYNPQFHFLPAFSLARPFACTLQRGGAFAAIPRKSPSFLQPSVGRYDQGI